MATLIVRCDKISVHIFEAQSFLLCYGNFIVVLHCDVTKANSNEEEARKKLFIFVIRRKYFVFVLFLKEFDALVCALLSKLLSKHFIRRVYIKSVGFKYIGFDGVFFLLSFCSVVSRRPDKNPATII